MQIAGGAGMGRGILHEAVVDERAHGGMGGLHRDVRAAGQLGERDAGLGVDVTEETELAGADAEVFEDRRQLLLHIADTASSAMTGLKRGPS
jgi:hypothetical protein